MILDLEDAVAPADKASARASLASVPLDAGRTVVRLNPAGTDDFAADLVALRATPYRTVMLAKTASAAQVRELAEYDVVALVETAAGVVNAAAIAAVPNVVALMWGADDLVASLGGTSSRFPDGRYRDVAVHARSTVLVAAGAHGRAAIDAVHMDIGDVAGLHDEATDAAACGFTATACIHPSQVERGPRPGPPARPPAAGQAAYLTAAVTTTSISTLGPRSLMPIVARVGRCSFFSQACHALFISGFCFMSVMKISAESR